MRLPVHVCIRHCKVEVPMSVYRTNQALQKWGKLPTFLQVACSHRLEKEFLAISPLSGEHVTYGHHLAPMGAYNTIGGL